MTTSHKLTVLLAVLLGAFLCCAGYGWLKAHDAALTLTTQQQADKQATATILATEAQNAAQLAATLKGYASLKVSVQTPAQVLQALPQVLALPAPVSTVTEAQAKAAESVPDAPKLSVGDMVIPAADVKPFYDAQVQCKVDAVTVNSCSESVTNLKALVAVDETEIKQQQTALKGGTKWKRTKGFMEHVGIGLAIGAATTAYLLTR